MTENSPTHDIHAAENPANWASYFGELTAEGALDSIGRGDRTYLKLLQDESVAALNVIVNPGDEERADRLLDMRRRRVDYEQLHWPDQP